MRYINKLKKIVSVVVVILIISSLTIPCFASSNSRDAANSVVMVYEQYKTSNNGTEKTAEAWGSGFAIGKVGKPIQYIVTNYHVVQGANENNGLIKVCFSVAANKIVQAELYWKNADKDLAILKLPEATTEREAMVLRMNKDLDYNDTYSALGYPGTETLLNTLPKFDESDITITRGGISKSTRLAETDLYLLDLKIDHGNSGGPLVNSKGEVVGINTLGFSSSNDSTSYYAIEIDELVKNVDRSIIPLTLYGEVTGQMIIFIVCGAIAFLIIVILIILVMKKSKKKQIQQVLQDEIQNEPIADEPDEVEEVEVEEVEEVEIVLAVSPVSVMGITGYFYGQNFMVDNKLLIGRDNNRCNVLFPIDQPGISGIHCEISVDSNGAFIKDLGSSYGTFLASGTKLTPNQPIKLYNGDVFYLADEENKFEVRIG